MKLSNNINYMGTFDQFHSAPFNLLSYLNEKILKIDNKSENIVLFTPKRE
jgi:hypothetical protein